MSSTRPRPPARSPCGTRDETPESRDATPLNRTSRESASTQPQGAPVLDAPDIAPNKNPSDPAVEHETAAASPAATETLPRCGTASNVRPRKPVLRPRTSQGNSFPRASYGRSRTVPAREPHRRERSGVGRERHTPAPHETSAVGRACPRGPSSSFPLHSRCRFQIGSGRFALFSNPRRSTTIPFYVFRRPAARGRRGD